MSDLEDTKIQRCEDDDELFFTSINNALLRNSEMSPESKWLVSYLLTHDKSFSASLTFIRDSQNIGRKKMSSMMKECEEHGYVKRIVYKGENNLLKTKFIVSSLPRFKIISPATPFRATGDGATGEGIAKRLSSKPSVCIVCKEEPENLPHTECEPMPKNPSPVENAPEIEICEKIDFEGKKLTISKRLIFAEAVRQRKDWTTQEIENAWLEFVKSKSPVRDVFEFFGGIVQNLRVIEQNKIITNKPRKEKICTQAKQNPSPKNETAKEPKPSNETCRPGKERTSAQSTSGQALHQFVVSRRPNWMQ
jgi:hypothetical protein